MSNMVAESQSSTNPNGRKLSTVSLKEFLKISPSKNETSANESSRSLDDSSPQRRSLPDRVSFATTWVTARLLRRHRERRARRMRQEAMAENEANNSASGSATKKSALSSLTTDDIETCKSSLQAVINNETCLLAFKEFLGQGSRDFNFDDDNDQASMTMIRHTNRQQFERRTFRRSLNTTKNIRMKISIFGSKQKNIEIQMNENQ